MDYVGGFAVNEVMNGAMSEVCSLIDNGDTPVLIICDHASNHVPADIDLGIAADLLDTHIAVDIGVAEVATLIAARLRCKAILAGFSRLVIDANREEDRDGLVPESSDGHAIVGNAGADKEVRLARFYRPYHNAVAAQLAAMNRPFILSLHSFTPSLGSDPTQKRPWEIATLYNDDDRAARIALPVFEAAGLNAGDQLPYSGRILNATMNRHGEANDIAYLNIEMRQDIVGTAEGQQRFADILAPIVEQCRATLA